MNSQSPSKRVVVTGMAVNTPLGDDLQTFYENLIAGRSAISRWKSIDSTRIYSKVGGDLGQYDITGKLTQLKSQLSENVARTLTRLVKKTSFATKLSVLCAVDAYINARLYNEYAPTDIGIIAAGHNFQALYDFGMVQQFNEGPEFVDPMYSIYHMDTTQAAAVGEVLGTRGPIYTVGGACASANIALRSAIDEIRHHDVRAMVVVAPLFEYAPTTLQALSLLGAISTTRFNDTPEQASRPFDRQREGFVPTHGVGVLVLEALESALQRGAAIHAELLGVTCFSDANHLPQPSVEGQAYTIAQLLKKTEISPEQIDYVNAHATSTPLGDLSEITSLKAVFGKHAQTLKINATKSMLGHCCWSSAAVETIAAILQVQRGVLHPSINIDQLDTKIDLDVCAQGPVKYEVDYFLKNSFGFGGINSVSLLKRYDS